MIKYKQNRQYTNRRVESLFEYFKDNSNNYQDI